MLMKNLKTPAIVNAHGLNVVVGEVALSRLPLLPIQHKKVKTAHDPAHLDATDIKKMSTTNGGDSNMESKI